MSGIVLERECDVVEIMALTDRLVVRTWADEDVEPLAAIRADTEVVRYLGGVPRSVADTRSMTALFRQMGETLGVTTWALEDRLRGRLVGHRGFARTNAAFLRPKIDELGWTLDRARWGRTRQSRARARRALIEGSA